LRILSIAPKILIWKRIKSILHNKNHNGATNKISLEINVIVTNNPKDITKSLNNYFTEIGQNLSNAIKNYGRIDYRSFLTTESLTLCV